MRYLDWPSKSPDLNIIENFWGVLVYANGKQFNTRDELKRAILAYWVKIGKRENSSTIHPQSVFSSSSRQEVAVRNMYWNLYISSKNLLKHPVDGFSLRLVFDFEDFGIWVVAPQEVPTRCKEHSMAARAS